MARQKDELKERSLSCLLGGAIGDAIGAPVEFMSLQQIRHKFGDLGITGLQPSYGKLGAITDDTQMMLFTAEGLLRGHVRGLNKGITSYESCIHHAYMRWLITQGFENKFEGVETDGWLIANQELHSRRAPGNTCISALTAFQSFGRLASNDSKGCGGVMRAAPIGVFAAAQYLEADHELGAKAAFDLGVSSAALTHGHPTGSLSTGAFAEMIYWLMLGEDLESCAQYALRSLIASDHHEETTSAIEQALLAADQGAPDHEGISRLGEGWVAEEALSIGLYAALASSDFSEGVLAAANHSGDSDSTALIAGHLLGAALARDVMKLGWLEYLELRDVIAQISDDLVDASNWQSSGLDQAGDEELWSRYPGY